MKRREFNAMDRSQAHRKQLVLVQTLCPPLSLIFQHGIPWFGARFLVHLASLGIGLWWISRVASTSIACGAAPGEDVLNRHDLSCGISGHLPHGVGSNHYFASRATSLAVSHDRSATQVLWCNRRKSKPA
jgi:hypothetical protein